MCSTVPVVSMSMSIFSTTLLLIAHLFHVVISLADDLMPQGGCCQGRGESCQAGQLRARYRGQEGAARYVVSAIIRNRDRRHDQDYLRRQEGGDQG